MGTRNINARLVWLSSIAIWNLFAIVAALTIYEFYRVRGTAVTFGTVAGMQFSQFLTFIPMTPLAWMLALRYPIQRREWIKPAFILLGGGLAFDLGHIALRGLTPYGYWDAQHSQWTFAFWNVYTHSVRNIWLVGKEVFLSSVFDDIVAAYIPIVVLAYAYMYYRGFHERELHAVRLEEQLANARLQTLKSQLQPHFLFNTLHSISALMMTDVPAADRMMSFLSDLLRMSLEGDGSHVTALAREIEFLGVYLDIEKIRFEERLQVVFDIAPECLDAQVPHLLLQPLVENAVRHGISKLSRGGEVRIIARRGQSRTLEMWIRDNGPGVSRSSETISRSGLGLKLTRERLAALYGERQAFEFRNLQAGGAEVYIRIPLRTTKSGALPEAVAHNFDSELGGRSR